MNRQTFNRNPPAQQCCEVCRAAGALQRAVDALNTFTACGGVPDRKDTRLLRVQDATEVWQHAKAGRHTGTPHAPVVLSA